jgi:predicted transposase YbfD/YdcC
MLFLCVCAVISGTEGWSAMAQFGRTKLDWLRRFLPYENGIPDEDTIAWLIKRLDIKAFERCFVQWATELANASDGEVIAIDGKTARRSHDRRRGRSPLHVVSAWACEQRLSLGQLATDAKSNEITAIPELLELLDIRGALITVDAMGCQKHIAETIISQQADYVLALKGNQGRLHEAVVDYFNVAEAADFAAVPCRFKETHDTGHGRIEKRTHYLVDDLSPLPDTHQWAGLAAVGMVISTRTDKASGQSSTERRYYLCSTCSIEVFAHAARAHWGVENSLHWVLDRVFREDESRIRSGDSAAFMNHLRQMANNLLRQVDVKLSVKARRLQAAIDDDFRERVIFQGT